MIMMGMSLPIIAALMVVYVFWGGTYLAMKFATETLPPFTMAGIRFLTAGGIMYAWQAFREPERPSISHWRNTAVVGGIMLLCGNGSIVWAEQHVPSGIAAIVFASVPCWVALLSWLWQGDQRPGGMTILGLVLGVIGISVLVDSSVGECYAVSSPWFAYAALVAAALFWAVGALYSRVVKLPASPFMSSALQMLTGGMLCLLFGGMIGEWSRLDVTLISSRSAISLGYLILFGSIIGFSAYIWLLKVADPTLVTTNTYVNPVVAVILGWVLGGEQLTLRDGVAAGIILLSVIIITKAGAHKAVFRRQEPAVINREAVK